MRQKKPSRMSLPNSLKVNVKPLKVIKMSMNMYAMRVYHHAQFEFYSLNIVRPEILLLVLRIIDQYNINISGSITISITVLV